MVGKSIRKSTIVPGIVMLENIRLNIPPEARLVRLEYLRFERNFKRMVYDISNNEDFLVAWFYKNSVILTYIMEANPGRTAKRPRIYDGARALWLLSYLTDNTTDSIFIDQSPDLISDEEYADAEAYRKIKRGDIS